MRFCECDAQRLNVLFGRDLGWEYDGFEAELPRGIDADVARSCVQFDRLKEQGHDLIQQFCEDDKFDRAKTGELTRSVRDLLGIVPSFAGEVRSWADCHNLTAYEIGNRQEGAKKQRWQRWLTAEGIKSFESMQSDLIEMGFRLSIEKI